MGDMPLGATSTAELALCSVVEELELTVRTIEILPSGLAELVHEIEADADGDGVHDHSHVLDSVPEEGAATGAASLTIADHSGLGSIQLFP